MDGRRDHPAEQGRRHPDPRRLSELQFLRASGWTAGNVYPRRSDHAVPRIRARPAPPADSRGRARRFRNQRGRVGRGRTTQPVHGEFLLGMGRAQGHDPARR